MSRVLAALGAVIGLIGLLGWAFDNETMKSVAPGLASMKAITALGLLLLGVSWLVPRRPALVVAALAVLLGGIVLVEYAIRHGLGVDQLLFDDPGPGRGYPGRPSITTAASLLLLGSARVLALTGRPGRSQACSVAVLTAGVLTLLGYAYGVDSLYSAQPFSTVALPTAVGTSVLAIAALASVHGGGLGWAVRSPDAGAQLVRRLLPFTLIGLPAVGYVCLVADRHGWVEQDGAVVAMLVVVSALGVIIVAWVGGRRIARVDRRRMRALTELTDLRDSLEQQVEERTSQIERHGYQIAVLEDRQRIAADLHDVVIQRLFAAGMYLQGANSVVADTVVTERINAAVEAMDGVIRDLRHSIFELGSRSATRSEITTAVDDLCFESSRVLGFQPEVIVDDPAGATDLVREDVLAVLREALANVARHARATAVVVELRVTAGTITLTVSDDGRGMPDAPHRSGTRNIAERARQRGGTCSWTAASPRGTRMRWEVPAVDVHGY